ncbi:MAG: DUF3566 domain-containing protein [Actinomycetota bacterium]|nr:DUF3566 domain-containing protein [Actinomycetota bacterium]
MDTGVPPTEGRPDARAAGNGSAASRSATPPDPRRQGTGGSNGNGARNGNGNGARNGNGASNGTKKKAASKNTKRGQQASRVHAPPAPRVDTAAVALVESPDASTTAAHPVLEPTADTVTTQVAPKAPAAVDAAAVEDVAADATVDVAAVDVVEVESPTVDADSSAPSASPEAAVVSADLADLLAPDTTSRVPFLLPPIVPAEPLTGDTVTVPEVSTEPAPEFSDTDGTDGLPSLLKPKKPARALKAPVVRQRRRPRVRRVTRVVRHVDTWSVFKVALVFNLFLYGVLLTAGVLLWQVAQNTGTVDNIERFFESFGWQTFELKGGEIFHNSWIAGLFLVVGLTGGAVLMATLFNLIADLVGGIRVSVLEEEVVEREQRGTGWRRSSKRVVIPEDPPEPA